MGALVKAVYQSAALGVVLKTASAADVAAGNALGRIIVRYADRNFLNKSGTNSQDVVLVHTGLA